jgi:hypothetical protein
LALYETGATAKALRCGRLPPGPLAFRATIDPQYPVEGVIVAVAVGEIVA